MSEIVLNEGEIVRQVLKGKLMEAYELHSTVLLHKQQVQLQPVITKLNEIMKNLLLTKCALAVGVVDQKVCLVNTIDNSIIEDFGFADDYIEANDITSSYVKILTDIATALGVRL